jgi:hypothetical protein
MSGTDVCTSTINTRLSTQANFDLWNNQTKSTLQGYTTKTSVVSSDPASLAAINQDITGTYACLQSKITAAGGTPNDISSAQEQILNLNDQIEQEEANAAVARDRVSYIRHPEQNTSNYESWFPIDRPIHTSSLLVIMSISLFLSVFGFLIIMSFLGIDLTLFIQPSVGVNRSGMFYWLYSQITPLTIILLITLIGVVYYFLNRS